MNRNSIKEKSHPVAKLRNRLNMTLKDFADALCLVDEKGVTQYSITGDAISKIECGRTTLSPETASRIHKVFHTSYDYLYGATDEESTEASKIIEDLKPFFNLVPSETSFDFHGSTYFYDYFTLKINPKLDKYLRAISKAQNLFQKKELPQEAYKYWVQGAQQEFNESFDKEDKELKEFVVLPVSNLSKEMLRILEEDKFQEMRKQNKLDNVDTTQ